jgi:COP9 signalosome complex subunit 1
MFIGRHSVSLCVDALKAAVVEAKNGRDVRRYAAIVQSLEQVAPHEPDATYDRDWMDQVTKENAHKTKELEDQLKSYKNNLIRDSIRVRYRS